MEDKLLIIMLAVLVVLGFGAILFFSGMLKKRRETPEEEPAPDAGAQPSGKGDMLDEFERTGILHFGSENAESGEEDGGKDFD